MVDVSPGEQVLMLYCYSWFSIIFLSEIAEYNSLFPEGIFVLINMKVIDNGHLHNSLHVRQMKLI